jgi:hypothetical protein
MPIDIPSAARSIKGRHSTATQDPQMTMTIKSGIKQIAKTAIIGLAITSALILATLTAELSPFAKITEGFVSLDSGT